MRRVKYAFVLGLGIMACSSFIPAHAVQEAVAPKDADPYGQAEVLLGAARGILETLKPKSKS